MPKPELIPVQVKLRKDQMTRLNLLRASLAEKMNQEMSMSDLLEKIVDDFLDSK